MTPHPERPAPLEKVVSIIHSYTFPILGQDVTALKIDRTNSLPREYTTLGLGCPDPQCMMAFESDGPGSAERAIAEHRRYTSNTDVTASHDKRAGSIIIIEGEPWFTIPDYNTALDLSENAKKRKRAKAKAK